MKKTLCVLLAAFMLLASAACGAKPEAPAEAEVKDPVGDASHADENEKLLSLPGAEDIVDPDYYAAVTAMEKSAVEELCAILRAAYLSEDWETIADHLRYPVSVNGTELKNAVAFLDFMKDKTIHESDREQMSAETCRDMFFNGEGICLGAGELWITDLSYMTEEPPEMVIIGINGIVEK